MAEFRAFLAWVTGKESMGEAAGRLGVTRRTFSARVAWCWNVEPGMPDDPRTHRYVMADGTYVPYGWCLLVLTGGDGRPIAWQWCDSESKAAYLQLLKRVKRPGLLVCDGGRDAWRPPNGGGWTCPCSAAWCMCCATPAST